MHLLNMREAKSAFSKRVDEAHSGEEVVIAKSGKPVARLIPYKERLVPRTPGRWQVRA